MLCSLLGYSVFWIRNSRNGKNRDAFLNTNPHTGVTMPECANPHDLSQPSFILTVRLAGRFTSSSNATPNDSLVKSYQFVFLRRTFSSDGLWRRCDEKTKKRRSYCPNSGRLQLKHLSFFCLVDSVDSPAVLVFFTPP